MTDSDPSRTVSRRAALLAPVPLLLANTRGASAAPELQLDVSNPDGAPFRSEDMGLIGVYDVDWLVRPEFGRMLDLFAASPGAIVGVRFFETFTAGQTEQLRPESGGTVWPDPDAPMDFGIPFAALENLIARNLTPFIALTFFPPAISASPIEPPANWGAWQQLVRAFLSQLAGD